jgi:archaetidylinositol phosphate synthase
MIEQAIRGYYQTLFVDNLARVLQNKIKPNTVTLISGLFGCFVLPALFFNHTLLAVVLLLLSGYCDTLDGTLARLSGTSTAWGSVLDIMMDRCVECLVVLALWLISPHTRGLWCVLMLCSMLLCITSFLVVGIFTENNTKKSFHYSPGLMERAEAFLFFIAMMLWPHAFSYFAFMFTLLVLITALMRLSQFFIQTHQINHTVSHLPEEHDHRAS